MTNLSRRLWLKTAGATLGATLVGGNLQLPALGQAAAQPAQPPAGPFTVPALPYANNALEAAIDAETMRIHHDRHHAAYVAALNAAVAGHAALAARPIVQILRNVNDVAVVPAAIKQAIINQGGGHYNHSMFWQVMGPNAGGAPTGALLEAINARFTNFDRFKTEFRTVALGRFGSGWTWLVYHNNRLEITSTANQDCPLSTGAFPVFGLDVWEHAYYLRYQNRRSDYIDTWWRVANWTAIAQRFNDARA